MTSATTRGVDKIAKAGDGALAQTGNIVQLFVDVARQTFVRPFQLREFIQQAWFIASVTILPTALIAIPFGAIVSLQTGSLIKQLGAESYTGAASVLVVVQQGSPLVTSLLVAMLLNGLVAVVGIAGGYFFNVILQGGTPGAYLASFSALAQLPDLYVAEAKAAIFGVIAGVVAAYKGLHPNPGPKGVGEAVNQTVVITFLLLFFANLILTMVYLQVVPAK